MNTDVLIIGAGPAGMAAAVSAAGYGASVVLLDEQASPGGQIYRGVAGAGVVKTAVLGPDYAAGRTLAEALANSAVRHEGGVTVWRVDDDGSVAYSRGGVAAQVHARQIIVATGALERAVPLPGWTLPGVMTAGAAQILLKSNGILPDGSVLVGSGPLLYLVAAQMIAAKAPPLALVETQTRDNHRRALRHLGGAVRDWPSLSKGLALLRVIRSAGIERHTAATDIRIEGEHAVEAVCFKAGGSEHRIPCKTALLHQGIVPNTQITRALRLKHRWNDLGRYFEPVADLWGATDNPLITLAGDGAGIEGAKSAELSGQIAALSVACSLGLISSSMRDITAVPILRQRRTARAIRPFLDTLYAPPNDILRPADSTIICRCEEVSAGNIRRYAALGCQGPNQTKAFGRCGMGPCQGRFCGLSVTEILAAENGLAPDAVGSYRIRAPLKPVTLGELASLWDSPEDQINKGTHDD